MKDKMKNENTKIVKELQDKCEELEGLRLRALADYQNLVKRTDEEKAKTIRSANERLIKNILVIVDDLEEASKHIDEDWISKVLDKLMKILKEEGLMRFGEENEDFDPSKHDAIEKVSGKEGKIVKVHRLGYMLGDKVIRPAIVAVGSADS